jgi:ABC-type antimicrobial peptide transport system permease subunit
MIVVNQTLAKRYFPDENPIGKVIRQNSAEPEWTATIIGVVADVPQWGPTYPPLCEMYGPYRLNAYRDAFVVVRSEKDPHALIPAIQAQILGLDRDLPMAAARTMQEVIVEKTRGRQFLLTLISMFAVIAMVLAMVGIFGTMSHNVVQRTREIGVRVAFGAHRRRILWMVLRDGLILSLVGIGVGFFLLWVFVGILGSQLYGIDAVNWLYGLYSVLLLTGVTLVATLLPAMRAGQVDPMQSLRFE